MAFKRNYIRYSRAVNGYKVAGITDIFHSRAAAEEACLAKYGSLLSSMNSGCSVVSITVPTEIREQIAEAASTTGMSASQIYWRGALEYLANLEAEKQHTVTNSFNLDELLRINKEGQ